MSPKEFTQEIKDKALFRQKIVCARCGEKLEPPAFPHFKKPSEMGGDTSLQNCVILCQKCHLEYGHIGKWAKFVITQDYPYSSASHMPY